MATKQRSRARRPHGSRDRVAPYVAPVLDPNWQNPYAPSLAERHDHLRAVRRFAIRRNLPLTIAVSVIVLALVVGVVAVPWLPAVAVVVAALYAWSLHRTVSTYHERGQSMGAAMLVELEPGGHATDRVRLVTVLDRLAATFGVDNVSAFIVRDQAYNAALVPDGTKYSMFVTSAMMTDFDLIELEGVVAHCLARQRLGLLDRQSLASSLKIGEVLRGSLAGEGQAYRADEVAAASIRYPLGLAGALRKCARQELATTSFFVSPAYDQWRWVFFDQHSDRATSELGDLDDVELRARALEEW
jgi:Zn-dependent protease with chaperone function